VKLRGAISGFGEVAARAHLPGWRTRPNLTIGIVHDPVANRRHEAIRLINGVRVYDDLILMLDGEAPSFVDVASPPAFHVAAARMALAAGAHVLIEKPMCLTAAEFGELTSLAAAGGRVLMCVHNWKFAPAYVAAHKAIESGRVGKVTSISFDRLRTGPAGAGGSGSQWRAAAASGGGILIDHGWHVFYLMQWLLGGAVPLAVSARIESTGNAGVDDKADVRVEFLDGVIAEAHMSWRAAVRRTSALISCEGGSLEVESDRVILTGRGGASEELPIADIPDDSYHSAWFAGVAEQFEAAINAGPASPAPRTNLAEARAALAIILASRESSSKGGAQVAAFEK